MKTCTKCHEEKPRDDFHRRALSPDGLKPMCKPCTAVVQRAYRLANPELMRERSAQSGKYRTRAPEARYLANIKRIYGLSAEQYYAMLEAQQGLCASCGDADQGRKGRHLHVDHCHTTGRVRGLLCLPCNVALGKMRDDPKRITGLLAYAVNKCG